METYQTRPMGTVKETAFSRRNRPAQDGEADPSRQGGITPCHRRSTGGKSSARRRGGGDRDRGGLAGGPPATARAGPVELGRFVQTLGRAGKDDRCPGGRRRTGLRGVPCVFGIPGAQNNELWDALKARRVPYLLVAHEVSASVMADAAARATGEVGVFSVVPGPGLTNAMTGIGEALLDSVPIVGIITDVDLGPRRPGRPGPRAGQRRDRAADRQGV